MKKLIIALTIFLLACTGFGSSGPDHSTLFIQNNSGHTVRIFVDDGFRYPLGRAWPGSTCFTPRTVSSSNIRFGIQHQGAREVWQQEFMINHIGVGWVLEIHQPSQAIFDMLALTIGERCK